MVKSLNTVLAQKHIAILYISLYALHHLCLEPLKPNQSMIRGIKSKKKKEHLPDSGTLYETI